MRLSIAATLTLASLGAGVTACRAPLATPTAEYRVEPVPAVIGCESASCGDPAGHVELTYLGVGGIMVKHRGRVLLTAPFFSAPSLESVAGGRVAPDARLIERLLPRAADSADAILVGHGHYDHLLDVPYVATRRARRATIYGGRTVRNILLGDPELKRQPARVVAIDSASTATIDREAPWVYTRDSAFRFMPVRAAHAPTLRLFGGRQMFAPGTVDVPLDTLPTRAADWKLGEQLSFVIDVLTPGDATTPVLRIYAEDAPNRPPAGAPPAALIARRAVDVAVLCAATATHVPDTPGALVAHLRPRFVVVTHWEDFFRPQTLPLRLNPYTDADAFMRALTDSLPVTSGWTMPLPRTTLRFAPRAG